MKLSALLQRPSVAYVAPFALFLALLPVGDMLPAQIDAPLRLILPALAIWVFSRDVVSYKARQIPLSVGLGVAVFLLWIAPDVLIHGYRDSWLFQNELTGMIHISIPEQLRHDPWILLARCARAVLIVPVIEELFWRAWLMRWLISPDFEAIPLGTFGWFSFVATAFLFGIEHGPFWDVGLATGLIYNAWMIRTRSLGDCILVHAVTNACLCGYVIATQHWEYWL